MGPRLHGLNEARRYPEDVAGRDLALERFAWSLDAGIRVCLQLGDGKRGHEQIEENRVEKSATDTIVRSITVQSHRGDVTETTIAIVQDVKFKVE